MKKVFYLLFFISTLSFSQKDLDDLLDAYTDNRVPYISVYELFVSDSTTIILDAREKEEFLISHIPKAKHIGYKDFDIKKVKSKIPNKNAKIIVYCSLGVRSEKIGNKLKKNGFTNVHNLYGGIFRWKNKGYDVIDIKGNKTEKIHVFSKKWSKWLLKGEKVYE